MGLGTGLAWGYGRDYIDNGRLIMVIPEEYKDVEFHDKRVDLLWNCCAIVKRLIQLEKDFNALEKKVEKVPEDAGEQFIEIEEEISNITTELGNAVTAISDNAEYIAEVDSDVDTINNRLSQIDASISELSVRVANNNNLIVNNMIKDSEQDTELEELNNIVDELRTLIAKNADNVSNMNTALMRNDVFLVPGDWSQVSGAPFVALEELWDSPYGGWLQLSIHKTGSSTFANNSVIGYISGRARTRMLGTYNQNTYLVGIRCQADANTSQCVGCYLSLRFEEAYNRYEVKWCGSSIPASMNSPMTFVVQYLDVPGSMISE